MQGDMVTLIRRVDKNWYEGRIGNRQGIFPVSYVEPQREPDTPMMTPMSSHAPTPVPGSCIIHNNWPFFSLKKEKFDKIFVRAIGQNWENFIQQKKTNFNQSLIFITVDAIYY